MKTRLMVAMAASLLLSCGARADEIKLLASAGLKAAYLELLPQFERESGHKVAAEWSSSPVIRKRIEAGEEADVVIVANVLGRSLAEELTKQGKIAGAPVVFAKSGVGVAVRAGAPEPDISSADALKTSLLQAKTITYSAGASGVYIASMLQKLGIYDQVKAKAVAVKPSEPVGEVVARGDAEIGFHQVSELLPVKGIRYLGPLPADIQNITVYSGGIHSGTKAEAAAKALVAFLSTPSAMQSLGKHGLEPG
ncbi:MAG: molybdate ABC transporter substrate-binding protein [Beijerinckiaceae bacterium]|jgi:molybdate transport system substrate-binding protein